MSRPVKAPFNISAIVGAIGGTPGHASPAGVVRKQHERARSKCVCGATLMVELDEQLHTAGTGVCIITRRSRRLADDVNILDTI